MLYRTIEVKTHKELREFISLPYKIYSGNSFWIPPVKSEVKRILSLHKNPYFINASLKLFNTYRSGEIVARCAVIIDRVHQQKYSIKNAFFGFFESINSDEAAESLLAEVENYCLRQGVNFIEGPFNPNLYSELGMLEDNFESVPSFFQTYNPPYYNDLLKREGFQVQMRLHIRSNKNVKEVLAKTYLSDLCTVSENMRIRSFNIKRKQEDLDYLRDIYNDAFSDNWHFTPVSREEYIFSSKYLNLVTPPELIKFIEYKGKPIGVIQFALDINPLLKSFNGKFSPVKYLKLLKNRKKIKRAIIFAVGIKKNFQHTRAPQLLFNATLALAKPFDELETTWMYDENVLGVKAADRLGMQPEKHYLIYGKELTRFL